MSDFFDPTDYSLPGSSVQLYENLEDLLKLTSKIDVLFITGDWKAKVGSQEIPGVTSKFGLGGQNEVGQKLTEFCQENTVITANTLFQQHKEQLYTWTSLDSPTKIRLIILFVAEDGDALNRPRGASSTHRRNVILIGLFCMTKKCT